MTKLRVYELARELNVETKVLLSKLKGGARNLSHQSTLTDQQIIELRGAFVAPVSQGSPGQDAGKRKVVIRRRVATVGEDVASTLHPAGAEDHSQEDDFTPVLEASNQQNQAVQRIQEDEDAGLGVASKSTSTQSRAAQIEQGVQSQPAEDEFVMPKFESVDQSQDLVSKPTEAAPFLTPSESSKPDMINIDTPREKSLPPSQSKNPDLGEAQKLNASSSTSTKEPGLGGGPQAPTGVVSQTGPQIGSTGVRRSSSQSATIVRSAQPTPPPAARPGSASSSAASGRSTTTSGTRPSAPAPASERNSLGAGGAGTNKSQLFGKGSSLSGTRSTDESSLSTGLSGGAGTMPKSGLGATSLAAGANPTTAGSGPGTRPLPPSPPVGSTSGLTPGAGVGPRPSHPQSPRQAPGSGNASVPKPGQVPLRQNVPGVKSPTAEPGSASNSGAYGRGPAPTQQQGRHGATGSFGRGSEPGLRSPEGPRKDDIAQRESFRDPIRAPAPSRGATPVATQVPLTGVGQQVAPSGAASPKRRDLGGATIVRKATPEEVENLQNQAAKRQQAGRKEDHRGTRVTGIGLLQNRISGEPAASLTPDPTQIPPPLEDADQWTNRKANAVNKDRKLTDEEEIAKKRAIKKSKGQSTVNMRALLEQVDDLERAEEDPAVAQQVRTIYTPSAPRSKRDLKRRKDLKKTIITTPRAAYRVIEMAESITVHELAKQMSLKSAELIKKLMAQGVMATLNQTIDADVASIVASEFGFEIRSVIETVDDIIKTRPMEEGSLENRPPIVTVMGHVDHGKTSILDAIRSENVAGGEAGGITQHIGAYSVDRNGKKITFLDTPGHEAFSAMRSRGAKLTDIVVLVVAADDGVMPQTIEAISHAKAANVPIIVALNKIDKPNVNFDRIYRELSEHGVQAEEWGGDVQFVKCSALQLKGIDDLLEGILLLAEVLDLKSSKSGFAQGIVIEAHLDKGRGPVATVVVERGQLRIGDLIVAGSEYGRLRAMHDYLAREVVVAGPSDPVEIIGLSGVPMAGDTFHIVGDEKTARDAADWRVQQTRRQAAAKSSAASLEDLLNRVKSEDVLEVPIILKADTQGSLEAIADTILKLSTPKVKNRIIHSAVGGVTESDITLGQASGALVIGFNVRAMRGLDDLAERSGVPIKYFSIIYEIVDAVKAIMVGKLPPIINEVIMGHAEVRKPINVPKIGTIAGSAVLDGKITRSSQCRLIRESVVIYTGKLGSLRRFKDDVKEVAQGFECGIGIEGYNDIREGDVIEVFALEESVATL